jgi:hypothetical protein
MGKERKLKPYHYLMRMKAQKQKHGDESFSGR